MDFTNKTALVTGGASGLGEATVRLFHQLGANVILMDTNRERGCELLEELEVLAPRIEFAWGSVDNEMDAYDAVSLAKNTYGGLHILVNCAGIAEARKTIGKVDGTYGPHSLDVFKKVVQVNLIGTFNMIRMGAFQMEKNEPNAEGERGVIINTASVAAYDGQMGQAAYSASKGGIVGMTLPIARDLARSGIRVMTIAPGLFETPLMASLPEDARISLGQQVPFPSRLGRPAEYALLAKSIVENPMLNGEVIRLDGAIRMGPK
jgi:NAD(P)-dependent dehydrogenase (short-subunit alcohol dehydrogenase family)